MSFRRYPLIQRGQGFGNIFGSIFRNVMPALKSVLRSPITKSFLSGAKNVGLEAAKNIAADVIGGENVGDSVRENVNVARREIANTIKGNRSRPKSRKSPKKKRAASEHKYINNRRKKARLQQDIFDYDDGE